MTFDPDWPHGHVTRDGRKARIICTDRVGLYPIVALIGDNEEPIAFSRDGICWLSRGETCDDLINASAPKRKLEAWVNVYSDGQTVAFKDRNGADAFQACRIACLHVVGEEGDGL